MKKTIILLACLVFLSGCSKIKQDNSYGVFIGAGPESVSRMLEYDIVVLDAQFFSEEQIHRLQMDGHKVYSYINIGSLEDFRPYYKDYESYTIGDYEHWDEEQWVDVSNGSWKSFILDDLAPDILSRGVDGLFVDNVDVYYYRQTEEIFDGITDILTGLKGFDTYVTINGGDTYVMEYMDRRGNFNDIADAVNQESIFSRIDWDGGTFSENTEPDREFFQEYVETVAGAGGDVYLLEYTDDPGLIRQIDQYCEEHGFRYYVSSTLELL